MKLFIWDGPYGVPYGGSMLSVIAPNLKAARKLIPSAKVVIFEGEPRDFSFKDELGEPDRVVDLVDGHAEFYEWSE